MTNIKRNRTSCWLTTELGIISWTDYTVLSSEAECVNWIEESWRACSAGLKIGKHSHLKICRSCIGKIVHISYGELHIVSNMQGFHEVVESHLAFKKLHYQRSVAWNVTGWSPPLSQSFGSFIHKSLSGCLWPRKHTKRLVRHNGSAVLPRERETWTAPPLFSSSSRNTTSFMRVIQLVSGTVQVKPFLILNAFFFFFSDCILWCLCQLADAFVLLHQFTDCLIYISVIQCVGQTCPNCFQSASFCTWTEVDSTTPLRLGSRLHFTNDNQCIKVFK